MESDWDTVTVLRKKPQNSKSAHSASAVNEARRSGADVVAEKKFTAGSNKAAKGNDLNAAKLDRETEELTHKLVSVDIGRAMINARKEKNLTQKDLAQRVNEKPQVITEYENGKAIPNQALLSKMEKVLGVKLRGKDIGQPLTRPTKK